MLLEGRIGFNSNEIGASNRQRAVALAQQRLRASLGLTRPLRRLWPRLGTLALVKDLVS
jgi:hypothetical protein